MSSRGSSRGTRVHERRTTRRLAPPPPARLVLGRGVGQQKNTLTRAEQQDYKLLKAKQARHEREADAYARMQQRAESRGDAEGAKFYRLMASAARSQLKVLDQYEARRTALKSELAVRRAEADAKKVAAMQQPRVGKPTLAPGAAAAWAREHPDEVFAALRSRGGATLVSGGAGDLLLSKLQAERGYDVTPHVATRAQLERMVDEFGAKEFYHGFNAHTETEGADAPKRFAQQFMKGAFYPSTGVFGNGFYVAGGEGARGQAHYFAEAMNNPKHRVGIVLRGALLPAAKFGNHETLKAEMTREGDTFLKQHGDTQAAKAEHALLYGDVGRYATSKGYDVIGNPDGGYWVVLNRGVVVAQRSLEKPSMRAVERDDTTTPRRKNKAATRLTEAVG